MSSVKVVWYGIFPRSFELGRECCLHIYQVLVAHSYILCRFAIILPLFPSKAGTVKQYPSVGLGSHMDFAPTVGDQKPSFTFSVDESSDHIRESLRIKVSTTIKAA